MDKTMVVIRPGVLSIDQYRLISQQSINILSRCDDGTLDTDVVTESLEAIRQGHRIVETLPSPDILDLDADPFVPRGWRQLVEHIKGGKLRVSKPGNSLCLDDEPIESWLNKETIIKKRPLNANFLDWLIRSENCNFIPVLPYWQPEFRHTIYRNCQGALVFRKLEGGHCSGWHWAQCYCHHDMSRETIKSYGGNPF